MSNPPIKAYWHKSHQYRRYEEMLRSYLLATKQVDLSEGTKSFEDQCEMHRMFSQDTVKEAVECGNITYEEASKLMGYIDGLFCFLPECEWAEIEIWMCGNGHEKSSPGICSCGLFPEKIKRCVK